jgi:hypothetical protein
MNIRDLPHKLVKKFAADGEKELAEFWKVTNGVEFGTNKSLDPDKIFLYAFSKGVSTVLKRIDEIKKG